MIYIQNMALGFPDKIILKELSAIELNKKGCIRLISGGLVYRLHCMP